MERCAAKGAVYPAGQQDSRKRTVFAFKAPGQKLLPSPSLRSWLGDAEAIPKALRQGVLSIGCKDI